MLRAKGRSAHPVLKVLLDFYLLVREVVEQRVSLQQLTLIDPLTGIWNRRALETHMEVYFSHRHPAAAVFMLFDLDHFKRLNDEYGHQAGDHALKEMAHYWRRVVRKEDWVARLGGDEFVMVLQETTWRDLFSAHLQRDMAWLKDSPLAAHRLGMTAGVVEIPREASTYQEAYRLADQRLYIGKQNGRNCIVFDEFADPLRLDPK